MEEQNWFEEWLAAGGQVPDKDAELESRATLRKVESDPEESLRPSGLCKPDGRIRNFQVWPSISAKRPAHTAKQRDWIAHAGRGHGCYSALEHWLERQCGQPWDEVYSRLCEIFDRRTHAGRKTRKTIVGTYGMVDEADIRPSSHFGIQDGILCDRHAVAGDQRDRKLVALHPQASTRKRVERILRGRQVMRRGGCLYWIAEFRRTRFLPCVRDKRGNALDLWGFPEVMRVQGKRLRRREEALILDYVGESTGFYRSFHDWLSDEDALAA